jgi:hypothetical protein
MAVYFPSKLGWISFALLLFTCLANCSPMFKGWRSGSKEKKAKGQEDESSSMYHQHEHDQESQHHYQGGYHSYVSSQSSPAHSYHSGRYSYEDLHDAALESKPSTPPRTPPRQQTAWSNERYPLRYTDPHRLEQAMSDLQLHQQQQAAGAHAEQEVDIEVPPLNEDHLNALQERLNQVVPRSRNRRSRRSNASGLPPSRNFRL